ncbi:MAG: ABC-F family ATP-binding cassette domain-containing protein [Sphaerochaetaceae bacterium]|nr:ABC-F family ATP-binding cassette domain-containing protein [Sphaerochaetaceae bacterium]
MGILQIQNIDLSFGDRTLLSGVSLTLGEHARAALAGGNGEGKSTLMKIIAGIMQCDGGLVTKTRGMRISYLPQSDIVFKDSTVFQEIEKGFSRFEENIARQRDIESQLQTNHSDSLLLQLNELQEELLDSSYYDREAIIYSVAKGLGFTKNDMARPCAEFSGGYQMRIALAKVLCESPDLMMLDEPTNYLDIEARTWLQSYLRSYKGSLFLVCHDKGFMDDTVNEVYELFNAKLTRYSGNYSFYEKQRKLEIEQLEAAYKKQQAEIEKTEQFIERFRYKATKSKQVQSRIKQLDKIEPVVVPSHLRTLNFSFPEPPHSPNDMVVIEKLNKNYGSQCVFKDFDMIVTKGQRLAVTGHNGIGKSTLLRIIAQQDKDIRGVARLGTGVKIGYFAQDTADSLDMEGTVLSQVQAYGTEGEMRNALGSFLFSGDDIFKKASVLSGGERSRLALLKILLQPASLLILDEPTNHLDINSKDMLLRALKNYKGTIIFVSHDAYFIREIADRILYLSDSEPEFFNGDYDYFQWKLDERLGIEDQSQKVSKGVQPLVAPKSQAQRDSEFKASFGFDNKPAVMDRAEANRLRNRRNKLKGEIQRLMESVDELEMQISEVNALMNLAENYSDAKKIGDLVSRKQDLEDKKNELELQWIEKSDAYEQEFGSEE